MSARKSLGSTHNSTAAAASTTSPTRVATVMAAIFIQRLRMSSPAGCRGAKRVPQSAFPQGDPSKGNAPASAGGLGSRKRSLSQGTFVGASQGPDACLSLL